MALPQSLARVPAFARPLKYSHTLASSLSRGGRGVSGLGPAEKALWVSVPSRYTWPISLTNENACPLTSCFCSVCAPVSQAPQRKAGTLGWSVKKEKEFLALLEVRVVLTTRRGFMKNLEVRTREKVMWAASAGSALSTWARVLTGIWLLLKRWDKSVFSVARQDERSRSEFTFPRV